MARPRRRLHVTVTTAVREVPLDARAFAGRLVLAILHAEGLSLDAMAADAPPRSPHEAAS